MSERLDPLYLTGDQNVGRVASQINADQAAAVQNARTQYMDLWSKVTDGKRPDGEAYTSDQVQAMKQGMRVLEPQLAGTIDEQGNMQFTNRLYSPTQKHVQFAAKEQLDRNIQDLNSQGVDVAQQITGVTSDDLQLARDMRSLSFSETMVKLMNGTPIDPSKASPEERRALIQYDKLRNRGVTNPTELNKLLNTASKAEGQYNTWYNNITKGRDQTLNSISLFGMSNYQGPPSPTQTQINNLGTQVQGQIADANNVYGGYTGAGQPSIPQSQGNTVPMYNSPPPIPPQNASIGVMANQQNTIAPNTAPSATIQGLNNLYQTPATSANLPLRAIPGAYGGNTLPNQPSWNVVVGSSKKSKKGSK